MIRGTTATFKFNLPCKKSELEWATIRLWQDGYGGPTNAPLPIIKRLTDCSDSDDPNELCVSLTTRETLRFSDKFKAKMQLRAKISDQSTVFASHVETITVYPINGDLANDDLAGEGGSIVVDDEDVIVLDGGVIAPEVGD